MIGGPNGHTTADPNASDFEVLAQLNYPSFLSSANLGLGGTGGTTALGGTNAFYFLDFVMIYDSTGLVDREGAGGFETATGSVVVAANTESANFVEVMLTGTFIPSQADAVSGYTNTPADLDLDFTSTCSAPGTCSVNGSGTLSVGQFARGFPVPEPATLALLGTGIAGLSLALRRKAS